MLFENIITQHLFVCIYSLFEINSILLLIPLSFLFPAQLTIFISVSKGLNNKCCAFLRNSCPQRLKPTQKYGIIRHKKNYFLKLENSLNILCSKNYFFAKKAFTFSGCMIASTKVYAPDFGDFTIFIALLNLFEVVCKDATVFFAIV